MPTVSARKRDENGSPTTENDITVEAAIGNNLLEALDDGGLNLPRGCLSGACCACKVLIVEGGGALSTPQLKESESLEKFRANFEKKHGKDSLKGREIRLSCQTSIAKDSEIIVCGI